MSNTTVLLLAFVAYLELMIFISISYRIHNIRDINIVNYVSIENKESGIIEKFALIKANSHNHKYRNNSEGKIVWALGSKFDVEETVARLPEMPRSHYEATRQLGSMVKIKDGLKILIIVISAYSHLQRRKFARETWARDVWQDKFDIQVLFLIGRPAMASTVFVPKVQNEMETHGDIIEADVLDTYRNLTLKTLSLLHLIRDHIPEVAKNSLKYIIKADDDILIDVIKLSEMINNENRISDNLEIICSINANKVPYRKDNSKWSVTESEWPLELIYPPYCNGPAYMFRPKVAETLLLQMERRHPKPFFWLEDVFITGVLASLSSVTLRGRICHVDDAHRLQSGNANCSSFFNLLSHLRISSYPLRGRKTQLVRAKNTALAKKLAMVQ